MPGFDGTGPRGLGSRTGWGLGFCPPGTGSGRPYGWFGRGVGRGGFPWGGGRGRAWGGGRGWGWRAWLGWGAYAPVPWSWQYQDVPQATVDEKSYLEEELSMLQKEMVSIKSRLGELASKEKAKKE